MKTDIFFVFLLLFFSCKGEHTEKSEDVPVIHLEPNEESVLKVSDYFDRVEAVLLQDTFFFGVEDFVECPDKYIVLASDHPGMMQGKSRYYVFNKEGRFQYCIGEIGRGAGEYQLIHNGLQLGEDSLLRIIDLDKYLTYSLDGKVKQEKALYTPEMKRPSLASPQYLWQDSLIIFESFLLVTNNPTLLKAAKKDSTYFCEMYSLNIRSFVRSYFPKKEAAEFSVTNLSYTYQDTFCYYYDKDRTIYQLLPGEKRIRYRIDLGKYNRLQTMADFYEEQESGVLREYITLSMCNETDKYILGQYGFKAKEYIFIYDKQTGKTKNFRRIDNDLLKTGTKNGLNYFSWKRGFAFKPDYLWSIFAYDWIDMLDQVKSQLNEREWKTYCSKYPDFIRIYDILVKNKQNKDRGNIDSEDDDEKVVLLKYYFK